MPSHSGRPEERRLAMVTGATGAIGKAIAARIAAEPGYEVVLVCRDGSKASAAAEQIRHATGNPRVHVELADLSRRSTIEALAGRRHSPVHVLVNNAAATPRRREQTPEGIELQLATNVLGYFWMIRALTPLLAAAGGARVVNVASYWAGGLDLDDIEFIRRPYDNDTAYRQSKQADRMLSAAFAERLAESHITVNACHPGDVRSTLSSNLGFGGHESPAQAADTPAWLATAADVQGVSSRYFERRRETACPFVRNRDAVQALYQACEAYS